jgi:hypothetical protein
MAEVRCRRENRFLVWLRERPKRTRRYPEKPLKVLEDER